MAANEEIVVQLKAEIGDLKSKLTQASDAINKFDSSAKKAAQDSGKSFNAVGSSLSQISGMLGGLFAIGSIISFGKAILDTTAKFETMGAVLTNTLGSSSQAQMAMQMITKFASETPFSVEELTGAFVKLANQGFKPSYDEMRKLGDLASSTGKSFGQLAEAILDAQTGEFERLKEFGIKASKEGDRVTFAFKGVATTVGNTSASIQKYLLSLGDLEGVSGAMAAISKTLEGKISNLGDAWTTFMKNLGDANTGPLKTTIDLFGQMLAKVNGLLQGKNIVDKLNSLKNTKNMPEPKLSDGLTGELYLLAKAWEYLSKTIENSHLSTIDKVFNDLSSSIADTKTKEGLQDLIDTFLKLRTGFKQGSEYWLMYGQMARNAREKIIALNKEEKKNAQTLKENEAARIALIGTIKGYEDAIKKLNEEKSTLKGEQLIAKQTEITKATQDLEKLVLKAKGITKGDAGYIEFEIKIKQDSLKGMKPGSGLFAQTEKEILALQDTLDNIDPTSIDGITREISRLEAQSTKLPSTSKELQTLKDKIIELTKTKQAFDDFFKVPPVGLYNTLQQELTDLQEAQKKATDKAGWDALQTKIKAVEGQLESLTVTTYTNAEAFKTIWQDAFAGFIQGTQGAFEQALWSGKNFTQNFKEAFLQMIKAMIAKLAAALVMALLLSVVLGGLGLGSISAGAKILGMSGITNFGTLLGSTLGSNIGGRVAMPTAGVSNSGQVAFEIQGDKLVGVLQNYNGRLNRLV
jgi:hypothetical protein